MSRNPASDPRSLRVSLTILWGLIGAELLAILVANDGQFLFTLDDPYIHLALAENLWQGNYGVNVGEVSSPASSVLWPFVIMPFAQWSAAWVAILIVNTIAASLTVWVFWKFLEGLAGPSFLRIGVLLGLMLVGNVVGLVLTGMEHSLQLLLCVSILYGLLKTLRDAQTPRWLPWVMILAPLIRFECLALTVPTMFALALNGQRRDAALALLGTVATLSGFSLFLVSRGMEELPASVLAKTMLETPSWSEMVLTHIEYSFGKPSGQLLALLLLPLIYGLRFGSTVARTLSGVAVAGVILHLMFGNFGWYDRYEAYVRVSAAAVAVFAGWNRLASWADRLGRFGVAATVVALTAMMAPGAWWVLLSTPLAAQDLYRQQFQMHRFVVDYWRRPVGINDLGLISYRNPDYVLDLFGLTSNDRRLARITQRPGWMEEAVARHDVYLAMLYEKWFPVLPSNWRKLGDMTLQREHIAVASGRVGVYAIGEICDSELRALLEKFVPTLPEGASFEWATPDVADHEHRQHCPAPNHDRLSRLGIPRSGRG
ncbi:MAG: hypothetical protein H6981_08445 [Gammaproteobacteria bacterium]|nr:hypothetical protein [Gammaproteobacteria bacterium]MCP5136816.1 hypothetical protein [Gammaproteobacteria bacterium]